MFINQQCVPDLHRQFGLAFLETDTNFNLIGFYSNDVFSMYCNF